MIIGKYLNVEQKYERTVAGCISWLLDFDKAIGHTRSEVNYLITNELHQRGRLRGRKITKKSAAHCRSIIEKVTEKMFGKGYIENRKGRLFLTESGTKAFKVYQATNIFERLYKHHSDSLLAILNFVDQEASVKEMDEVIGDDMRFNEDEQRKLRQALSSTLGMGLIKIENGMYVEAETMEGVYDYFGFNEEVDYEDEYLC